MVRFRITRFREAHSTPASWMPSPVVFAGLTLAESPSVLEAQSLGWMSESETKQPEDTDDMCIMTTTD